MDFLNIEYLKMGNERQRSAYQTLTDYRIMEKFSIYHPILVGTIPIEIDIYGSDLDILCCWHSKEKFIQDVQQTFGSMKGFTIHESVINEIDSVVANFLTPDFEIEIFGQNIPSEQQNGYRHMLIEYQILKEKGEAFRRQIIELKKQGIKTEPAFAQLLKIEGNPYSELLKYK